MKTYYYYFRDMENKPIITVCLLVPDHYLLPICRGVAICSRLDQPNKKVGRSIALGRARKAFLGRTNTCLVSRKECLNIYDRAYLFDPAHNYYSIAYRFLYKSECNVTLTDFERKLINRAKGE